MKYKKKVLVSSLISILTIIGLVIAFFAYQASISIPSAVKLEPMGNLLVYWDSECTNRTVSMYWGELRNGEVKSYTLYIKSNSTVFCTYKMNTSDWNPEIALLYLNVTWDGGDYVSYPSEVFPIVITLEVSYSVVPEIYEFFFYINIYAFEYEEPSLPEGGAYGGRRPKHT